jgi:glycosyltransferase involved in cell wall biosynthesis
LKLKKILFIASHRPNRAPAQRFRFEQFLEYFKENGFYSKQSYFIFGSDDQYLYRKGAYVQKFRILVKAIFRRLKDVSRANEFDIIFIQRESFLLGSTYFERKFRKSKAKLIYDFDDSIWLGDTSDANKKLRWLKYPGKIDKIISICDMIFAGNKYLANYASYYNDNVKVVPTTIDTEWHKRTTYRTNNDTPVCIGWTGSITTIKHFQLAVPVLVKLKEKYGNRISFKVFGDANYSNEELNIKGIPWNRDTEIEELSTIDIGIMPLPNDEWSKGKCGLKGLQYMALEIPAIMSPVGVNNEIINEGVNGFLAKSDQEWFEKLSLLIDDAKLRETIGKEARRTVVENYSKDSEKGNYIKYFNELLQDK